MLVWMRPRSRHARVGLTCLALGAPLGCESPSEDGGGDDEAADADADTDADTDTDTDTGGEDPLETTPLNHSFGTYALTPFEEIEPCAQWTLDNEAPVYVQAVTLSNLGYFHHSNWFVVPEDEFAGEDGFFHCGDRGYTEFAAAMVGTVLTAQSTQSFTETQRTGDGAVIKIPAGYKVIGSTHMLNVGPAAVETELFMGLELIHPKDVLSVLTPFRLSYTDLDIPPLTQSHFTGVCDKFGDNYQGQLGLPVDHKLHYVVPHYHYLGNYFQLSFMGGEHDGQTVYEIDGFNGEANGKTFDPPLDLSGTTGLDFTCGYDNWRDVSVGWGIGDQEMCVMLALAESEGITDMSVIAGSTAVGEQDGVVQFEGACSYLVIPKKEDQGLPTDQEREGELYIPPSGSAEIPAVPECVDHDEGVAPSVEPTLDNIAGVIFEQSCSFNACHGAATAAAGLDLVSPNLGNRLLDHEVLGNPGASLVEPGSPENSWLYQVLSECEPEKSGGGVASHMPLNSPFLLNDEAIALVREWIADGAML
ncbi:hypothetical protein PPSIR1_27348 [Plesiocystis pacifica SIR-1]|uniref:Cytochrome c domain-containing protein n=1 Tax=Plesiocystis pacifica SIR-1 TaxID=391625 RepID=A6G4N4_9BACT|nr:hypothetical protein [Plesiocystis pacifica]EDM79154.1 hypothetical protein PPSIR1_27348 [Plesiocystis pacifica SIR-1]